MFKLTKSDEKSIKGLERFGFEVDYMKTSETEITLTLHQHEGMTPVLTLPSSDDENLNIDELTRFLIQYDSYMF